MGIFVRLTGNAGRNDDDISTGESLFQTVIIWQVARDFLLNSELYAPSRSLKKKKEATRTAIEEMCERSVATPGVLTTS